MLVHDLHNIRHYRVNSRTNRVLYVWIQVLNDCQEKYESANPWIGNFHEISGRPLEPMRAADAILLMLFLIYLQFRQLKAADGSIDDDFI